MQKRCNEDISYFSKNLLTRDAPAYASLTVSSPKTSILLDSTVSSIEITNSPSFTVQVLGTVPTILVDSTDGGQIYLSRDSLGVEVITSKTSGLNISLPLQGGEEGEFIEKAVPEQMKTVIGTDGKLQTEIVEHSG